MGKFTLGKAALFFLLYLAGLGCLVFYGAGAFDLSLGGGFSALITEYEVKSYAADGKTLTSTDGDPWIVLDVSRCPAFAYVKINIDDMSEKSSQAQIFYTAEENNFSEEGSVWGELRRGANIFAIPLNSYSALRLDLTAEPGVSFTLGGIGVSAKAPLTWGIVCAAVAAAVLWALLCRALYLQNFLLWWLRLKAFKKYSYLMTNLVKKDFTTKYRRSVLGVLWSVLNPLMMMAVISAVFSNVFRIQIENFAVYYLTGSLVFNFMAEATSGALTSVLSSGGLIKKVYIPKYIFPLEKCLFALVNTAFSLVAVLILMPILGVPLRITALLFWLPLAYVLVFSAGFGMILAAATVFFRDIGHLYGVWVTAWMYLTPILYPVEMLPDSVRWVVGVNPMYYYVDYFRQVMMYGTLPDPRLNLLCAAMAVAFLALGLLVFKKTQDRFILFI
jgi:ABC-2 type transport system permease protein